MAEARDLFGHLAAQYVDHVRGREAEAARLLAAEDRRQQLARVLGRVAQRRRCQAVVAVAAGAAGLAEVREQAHTATVGRLGQGQHRVELGARQPFVVLVGLRLFDQPALLHDIGKS